MLPAIFLDRDGTINIDKKYLYKIDDFEFEVNAIEGLKLLSEKGYILVVVTNQSGIGRGFYSREDADKLHEHMCSILHKHGVHISRVYMCPHTPDDACECRKPLTKLFVDATLDYNIDLSASYCVGDKLRDVIPAKELKCKYALLKTGQFESESNSEIDSKYIFDDLLDFANSIPSVRR